MRLLHLGQRLLHVLVLLAAEERVLGTGARLLQPVEEGGVAVLVDGGVEREVDHRSRARDSPPRTWLRLSLR